MKSNYCPITCGVPQGSTLGPLFALIYVNDFLLALIFIIKLFASDTVLKLSHVNDKSLINKKIIEIAHWLKINKFSLNYKKNQINGN